MKKILCLVSLLGLCACDFQEQPKCWNGQVKAIIAQKFSSNHIKLDSIENIKEIPVRETSDIPKYKQDVRFCKADINIIIDKEQDNEEDNVFEGMAMKMLASMTSSEKITRHCVYVTYAVDTEYGKSADIEILECQ